jgi:elongation factor G
VRDILPILQPASSKPLVLRQIPIWENGTASGFRRPRAGTRLCLPPQANAEVIEIPAASGSARPKRAFKMLEQLADYDDEADGAAAVGCAADARQGVLRSRQGGAGGLIVPVLLGSAENGNGILRLLKALRHEAPFVDRTAKRHEARKCQVRRQVLKTMYYGARRQDLAGARAGRRVRRRHGRAGRARRGARGRPPFACWAGGQESGPRKPGIRWRWVGWRRS